LGEAGRLVNHFLSAFWTHDFIVKTECTGISLLERLCTGPGHAHGFITGVNVIVIWSKRQVAFNLAREHVLSFYDALYLELAKRREAALATLDAELARAARAEGLEVASP
jgi:hypothetical protein